jgi:hypothetical protein
MGTKTNINFLGTGDKAMKGTTFGGPLRDDFLEIGVSQDDLIKVVEQDMGYVTSGKLNDSQLKVMTDNLTMARDTLKPVPPTNLFDIATGTGNLNKKGLESLRGTSIDNTPTPLTDKISEGINRLKVQKTGFAKRSEVGDSPAQALDRGFMEAEGARRAVLRQVLLKDENALKSLPEGMVDSLKYSRDLQGIENRSNDPLILFRAIYGDAIDFNKIDDVIASEPFGDANSIADKVLAFLKQGDNFANGGRIGYRSGRSVKGIMDLIKSKFGKDSIKVADEVDSSAFYKSPLRSKKQMTDDEIQAFADEFGIDPREEYYDFDGTFASANKIFKDEEAYKAEMYDQYITGKLDPVAGDNTPARMKFLQRNADEARDTGDTRLFNRNDADELDNLESQFGSVNTGGIRNAEVPVEMMTEDLLLVKYPGISERLAKQIGNDKDLQRKAEAIAEIERALALQESGKSVDETISILNREPKIKMKKGGLARILEM